MTLRDKVMSRTLTYPAGSTSNLETDSDPIHEREKKTDRINIRPEIHIGRSPSAENELHTLTRPNVQ